MRIDPSVRRRRRTGARRPLFFFGGGRLLVDLCCEILILATGKTKPFSIHLKELESDAVDKSFHEMCCIVLVFVFSLNGKPQTLFLTRPKLESSLCFRPRLLSSARRSAQGVRMPIRQHQIAESDLRGWCRFVSGPGIARPIHIEFHRVPFQCRFKGKPIENNLWTFGNQSIFHGTCKHFFWRRINRNQSLKADLGFRLVETAWLRRNHG